MWRRGSSLRPEVQAECKRRFIHRYTREHVPEWVRRQPELYGVQFASDADWLEHTEFCVRGDGKLNERVSYCMSSPTWPDKKG